MKPIPGLLEFVRDILRPPLLAKQRVKVVIDLAVADVLDRMGLQLNDLDVRLVLTEIRFSLHPRPPPGDALGFDSRGRI